MVFFPGLGDGLLPFGVVDGIGVELGFQSDAAAFAVFHAALALTAEEIARVELNAGQVGVNGHDAAGNRIGHHGAGIAEHFKIVVVAALEVQGLVVLANVSANGLGGAEIHGRTLHAAHFSGGDAFRIGHGEYSRGQHQQLIHGGGSVVLPGQIEIAVVGQVENGIVIAHSVVCDVQAAFFIQTVGDINGGAAGISLVAIGAFQMERNGGIGIIGHRPHPGMVEVGAGMEVVAVLVGRKGILPVTDGERAAFDPVGAAADNGAQEAGSVQVAFRVIIAQSNVGDVAVGIGNEHVYQRRAEISHCRGDAAPGNGVQKSFFTGGKLAKRFFHKKPLSFFSE